MLTFKLFKNEYFLVFNIIISMIVTPNIFCLTKRGAFLFVGQFLRNFLYETPLAQIKKNKMKKMIILLFYVRYALSGDVF